MRKELSALVRRHLGAENAHKMEETPATLHPDCLFEDMARGPTFRGRAGAERYYRMWWEGLRIVVQRSDEDRRHWTEDGAYIAETRFVGTQVGPFLGVPASGRTIDFRFIVLVLFRDGLMAGERFYYDLAGLMRQLGADRFPDQITSFESG